MSEENGSPGKAIAFLQMYRPGGPWALTAIAPDRKSTETKTFAPDDQGNTDHLYDWLADLEGKRNVYFHVNPTIHAVKNKASRTDIKSVDYLHVDIDPRPGQPLEDERKRCLALLTTDLPKGIPTPSYIVFSGGGYGAFWRLQEPIPIDGDLAVAEEAKRYNQQLEQVFGGDNCHNIDRLMRLPGTLNLPTTKKKKEGRTVKLARLLQADGTAYALDNFTKLPAYNASGPKSRAGFGGASASTCRVEVGGNVRRLESLNELDEYDVGDRVKVICVQGFDPEKPKTGDSSRSAWLFDVVCQLVRSKVPDEIIYSVITDPALAISDSVRDKGSSTHKYAIQQIENAKEHAISPHLYEMNQQYAVIRNMGGKCRIIERIEDPELGRHRVTKQSFQDFQNSWMHIHVALGKDDKGRPLSMPLGKWWVNQRERRQYRTLVFAPEQQVRDAYNLWQGFNVEAIPGDCSLMLDHLYRNICGGNEQNYEYLLNWMARAVQQPWLPGEVAVVLRGDMGVGKSLLAKCFGQLWGPHYMVVSNSSHVVGNFNAHLRDVCFLFADEAFFAGDKKHRSVLKSLITDDMLPVESKGVDVEMQPNRLHVMMASNEQHVIPAGKDERRYLMLDVQNNNHQDTDYFGRLVKQMWQEKGHEAFLHFLRTRDIKEFDVRKVPKTKALQEQKIFSLRAEEEWWFSKLQDGRILQEHDRWQKMVPVDLICQDYGDQCRLFNSGSRGTATQLGFFLRNMVPSLDRKQVYTSMRVHIGNGIFEQGPKKRYYHYIFPSLEQCRQFWEERYGPYDWPAEAEEPEPETLSSPSDDGQEESVF